MILFMASYVCLVLRGHLYHIVLYPLYTKPSDWSGLLLLRHPAPSIGKPTLRFGERLPPPRPLNLERGEDIVTLL